ncbi:hypothetical protein KSK32_00700 [Micromonospora sp. WMMB482]|uniref:hypothetical protein n=1 Tax=Micromonospora sp. WMMB482 TaxID=2849653 RepID=UPI001C2191D9|nr:hypothetical protein [Micromonospora sp. WMMB482]MBU8855800.1 hypothetical protein [Micromonospora sp. WMMB482]
MDVTPGCQLVVGGRFTAVAGGPATTIGRGGAGTVLLLDGAGRRSAAYRPAGRRRRGPGGTPAGGEIAVATDRGVMLLDPTADRVRWQRGGAAAG